MTALRRPETAQFTFAFIFMPRLLFKYNKYFISQPISHKKCIVFATGRCFTITAMYLISFFGIVRSETLRIELAVFRLTY